MNVSNGNLSRNLANRDKRDFSLQIPIGLLNDLSAARTRDETLQCFTFWSHQVVDADRCSVALFDGEHLVVHALAGNQAIPNGARLPIDGTLMGDVFKSRQGGRLTDLANQPSPHIRQIAATGTKVVMIAPLLAGDTCFGTLSFGFFEDCYENSDLFAMITALGTCLATQLLVIEQIASLNRLVETDPLTGVYNRRYFYDYSETLLESWRESQTPFALASMDIDHFKLVNDTYGHDAGDKVLTAVTSRIKAKLRDEDVVVRMGGEEFVAVLKNCTGAEAEITANRVRKAIANNPVCADEAEINVTVSIGIADVTKSKDIATLLQKADSALYRAKSDGRNRVVCSTDLETEKAAL